MKPENEKRTKMKIQTSEYCAVGHPDRTCDFIVAYILDRYLEADKHARVALEVQLKDHFCTLSGEVSSRCRFTESELANFCRDAIRSVGYTDEYRSRWGEENAISAEAVEVTVHVSQQSPDIAQGIDRDGWGDQGIFWGMAVNDPKHGYMPKDYYFAREIANALMESRIGGLDIKTQVTCKDGVPIECVVAIPLLPDEDNGVNDRIVREIKNRFGEDCAVIVNGTGRYVKHGSIGDCGTTGRKLVVDFYGGNAKIGGGSPWGKDPTKADVTLNILAREKALRYLRERGLDEVHCSISCCIGKSEIRVSYYDGEGRCIESRIENDPPSHIIEKLALRSPGYAETCRTGLFGYER